MTNLNEKQAVEKIRNNYIAKTEEVTKFEELKQLDKKVKRPTQIFGYTYGSVGALVLGTGMCLAMKVIGNLMPLGIVVGLLGIVMVCSTYPIYQKMLAKRKAQYSSQILQKSDELLNN